MSQLAFRIHCDGCVFADFRLRKGSERFLHDSAGFVSCCFAFGGGHDQQVASLGVVCASRLRRRCEVAERRFDPPSERQGRRSNSRASLVGLRLRTNVSNAQRRNDLRGCSVISVFDRTTAPDRTFARNRARSALVDTQVTREHPLRKWKTRSFALMITSPSTELTRPRFRTLSHDVEAGLLPSSTERLVELYYRERFFQPDLSQYQLGLKQITISIQGVELGVDAASISDVGQA